MLLVATSEFTGDQYYDHPKEREKEVKEILEGDEFDLY
jgi:hypothetical protein